MSFYLLLKFLLHPLNLSLLVFLFGDIMLSNKPYIVFDYLCFPGFAKPINTRCYRYDSFYWAEKRYHSLCDSYMPMTTCVSTCCFHVVEFRCKLSNNSYSVFAHYSQFSGGDYNE